MQTDPIIRPKDGLTLRRVGNFYIVADAEGDDVDLTNVYHLNETAARLWQLMAEGSYTADRLASLMAEIYEQPADRVRADVLEQIAFWRENHLLAL